MFKRLGAGLMAVAGSGACMAQTCVPTFGATFNTGELNGVPYAIGVGNIGGGVEAFAGGEFTYAAGYRANGIAAWNGSAWRPLGEGFDAPVRAVAVFDDGSGPALYAGGDFMRSGSTVVSHIARWNGTAWTGLGLGLDGPVNALLAHDDGSGPALIVGGQFDSPAGLSETHLARWRATGWLPMGSADHAVLTLALHDDGGGPALYAGGWFTMIGGQPASHVAKWNGVSWSALGSGTNNAVHTLASYDQPVGGRALFAGGRFNIAGGVPAVGVARWSGQTWSAAANATGNGANNHVDALAVHDGKLWAGGKFTAFGTVAAQYAATWDGAAWAGVYGVNSPVRSLCSFPGSPAVLLAGGAWVQPYYAASRFIQGYGPTGWVRIASVSTGLPAAASPAFGGVEALVRFDSGSGPELYAGGAFKGSTPLQRFGVERWTGSAWAPVGDLTDGVKDLAVYDDGSGPKLYACGEFFFTTSSGVFIVGIARWSGTAWESPGGVNSFIRGASLQVFDEDGPGPNPPALFLGGAFEAVGSVTARSVARWDGSSWSAVGDGLANSTVNGLVNALAVHDDGSGPALYAAGSFDHSGALPCRNAARWNGSSWSAVGDDLYVDNTGVQCLLPFNDGSGAALYAGGSILSAAFPYIPVNIRRWRMGRWEDVAGGLSGGGDRGVACLAVFDDGSGPALFAGGDISLVLRKLTPAGWVSSFPPLQVSYTYSGGPHAMLSFDLGQGPVLIVGGSISGVGLPGGIYTDDIVEFRGCPCYANCDGSTFAPILNVADFICFMNRFAAADPWANCDGSTIPPILNVADFICFGNKFAAGCP